MDIFNTVVRRTVRIYGGRTVEIVDYVPVPERSSQEPTDPR